VRRSGRAILFVDGKPLGDFEDRGIPAAGVYYVGAINKSHLGQALHFFRCVIDDVRSWNRALDDAAIEQLAR
jgi:hypothetical protein